MTRIATKSHTLPVLNCDTLERVNFGAGYLDSKGKPHFLFTDWQGNVTMTTDSRGRIEQHIGYYPYGEPWREPAGQRLKLYGGKERQSGVLAGDYDFGPRSLTFTTLFNAPDSAAIKYPHLSPWTYCAANPIRNIDPTGNDIFILNLESGQHLALLIQEDNKDRTWKYYSINGNNVRKPLTGEFSGGREKNDIAVGGWRSPKEFLNSYYNVDLGKKGRENYSVNNYGFQEGYQIKTTREQDRLIKEKFEEIDKTTYNVLWNNCATAVQDAMKAGGLPVRTFEISPISLPSKTSIAIPIINYKNRILPSAAFKNIMRTYPNGTLIKK